MTARRAMQRDFLPANSPSWAPLGHALQRAGHDDHLRVRHVDGREHHLTLRDLRRFDGFSDAEFFALERATEKGGRVLDLGCGAGAHCGALGARTVESWGVDVAWHHMACARRNPGANSARFVGGTLQALRSERFDTILLLMNGLGLAGTAARVPAFLATIASKLRDHGQVLVESCDLRRCELPAELALLPARERAGLHFGDSEQQLIWGDLVGEPFDWVYLPAQDLESCSADAGLRCQVVFEGEGGAYLAQLVAAPR